MQGPPSRFVRGTWQSLSARFVTFRSEAMNEGESAEATSLYQRTIALSQVTKFAEQCRFAGRWDIIGALRYLTVGPTNKITGSTGSGDQGDRTREDDAAG